MGFRRVSDPEVRELKLVDVSRFKLPDNYRRILTDEELQRRLRERFGLSDQARAIKVSTSICPVCARRIPMVVYEEDGRIWLKKVCDEHGVFEDLYWGDAEMYYYWLQWDRPSYVGRGVQSPNTSRGYYLEVGGCPMACGICPNHRSNTILAIIDVTNRCNMACPICFAYAGAKGYVYEPSLEEVELMLKTLRSEAPWAPNAIQLSGGEPTLRDDLPTIIEMAKRYGFDHVEVNTNGIRLAYDTRYYGKILEAGTSTLYLQFDTIDAENMGVWKHRAFDPRRYVETRVKVVENARSLGHRSIVPVVTLAKGYNDRDLGKIIEFSIKNRDVIRWVNIQPVSFAGRARNYSREEMRRFRITIPDAILEIERQTNGAISRWDWRPVNWPVALAYMLYALTGRPKPLFTNNPVCGAATMVFYDEDEGRIVPITRVVDVDSFEEFAWSTYRMAMRGGAWRRVASLRALKLLKYVRHKLIRGLISEVIRRRSYDALREFMFNVVGIGIMHFMDLYNYDLQRVSRCTIHYAVPDGRIIPFCTFNNFHRELVEDKFKVSLEEWRARRGIGVRISQ